MYEPLKIETCKKCKNVIAEPKELVRIVKRNDGALLKCRSRGSLVNFGLG